MMPDPVSGEVTGMMESGLESCADKGMNPAAYDSGHGSVLQQYLNASARALDTVRMAVHGGDPDRLEKAMVVFLGAFEPVQQYITRSGTGNIMEEEMDRLRQLEIGQRKAMRFLTEKMDDVQENIHVIEDIRSRLRKTVKVAEIGLIKGVPNAD